MTSTQATQAKALEQLNDTVKAFNQAIRKCNDAELLVVLGSRDPGGLSRQRYLECMTTPLREGK